MRPYTGNIFRTTLLKLETQQCAPCKTLGKTLDELELPTMDTKIEQFKWFSNREFCYLLENIISNDYTAYHNSLVFEAIQRLKRQDALEDDGK